MTNDERVIDSAVEKWMDNLDPEDQVISDSITQEMVDAPVHPDIENLRKDAQQIAKNTIKVRKMQLTIRPQAGDIDKIKVKAAKLGIPFHTYINSIIHLAANGDIGIDYFKR